MWPWAQPAEDKAKSRGGLRGPCLKFGQGGSLGQATTSISYQIDLSVDPQIAVCGGGWFSFRANSGLWSQWGRQNLNTWKVRCAGSDAGECWGGNPFCWSSSFVFFLNLKLKKFFHGICFSTQTAFSPLTLIGALYILWDSDLCDSVSCTSFSEEILEVTDLLNCSSYGGSFRPMTWAKPQNV